MLTLKKVTKAIQVKHPHVELVKGDGYYYIRSEHQETALKISTLPKTSIEVYTLNQMTIAFWVEIVDQLLAAE